MPLLLALDISVYSLTIIAAASLLLLVLGGLRSPLSIFFALYAGMVTAYSVVSLLLRLSLWLGVGTPELHLQLSALSIGLTGPLLLLFARRYLGLKGRWTDAVSAATLALLAAFSPFIFMGRLLSGPVFTPNGVTTFRLLPAGLAAAAAAGLPMAISAVLFWVRRTEVREPFLALSASVAFVGFVVGGVFGVRLPLLAYTNVISVGILGYAVVRRQMFNPFRALSEELERKIAERTTELQRARAEVERTVEERTSRLIEEIGERRAAEESLRERARRLELIARIGQKTTALLSLDDLLAQAVTLISDAFSYFSVGVLLIEGEWLVTRASSLETVREMIGTYRLKIGEEGLCGHVAATGEPLLVNDVSRDPRYRHLAAEVETKSELDVPIRLGGKVIGVLDAQSALRGGFTELDLFTMQTIADQLATAIGNGRLYEQAMRRTERLALVGSISAAVSAVLNLPDLLETVHRDVTPIFAADAFFIALYDAERDELDFRIQVDEGAREAPAKQRVGGGLTSRVIRQRKSLLVSDMQGELASLPAPEIWGTGKLPSSWLGAPLLVGERLIGVICVQTYTRHSYDEEDRGLLETVADQVAVAVENARLYEALRQELGERQRTETRLRESEEQFRNLAEQSPNMIFVNRGGAVVYANRQCEVMTGRTREEMYAPSFRFLDIAAPEHRELLSANFLRHTRGEEVAPYEYTIIAKDGRRIDSIITTKLISHTGDPAILGIITDISTRKRTERLLRGLNAAALAMEQAFTPTDTLRGAVRELAALGFSCTVFLADDARSRLAPRFECGPGREVRELADDASWHPLDLMPEMAAALRGRETILTRVDPDRLDIRHWGYAVGTVMYRHPAEPFATILAPLSVGEDAFGLLAVQGENMGEEDLQAISAFAHQTAAAWRKTTLMRDLGRSLEELRATQEQLLHAQKMEAIGRLAGGIAHDFNNVLTVISGFTALLFEGLQDNRGALADLGEIKNAIKRAAALTSRLLAFSRKQILQPQVLDLNAVVGACATLMRPLIGEDIDLIIRPGPDLGPILADPYQIEQVIINLAVNARDAMPEGGKLIIETANTSIGAEDAAASDLTPGPHVVLTIRDTGIGMSEEVKSHLFEPFFTTKAEGRGTGLGLSTVYGIVTQSGGAITVESSSGLGSTFTITIPCTASARPTPRPEAPARAAPRGTGTILLAEDDELVRELAERILQRAGYTVLVASSGEEAVRTAAAQREIRLAITDVVMPGGMSGVELAELLGETRPGMPVLFISGYTEERSIHLGVPRGLPFLAKPFQPEELLTKVSELLG